MVLTPHTRPFVALGGRISLLEGTVEEDFTRPYKEHGKLVYLTDQEALKRPEAERILPWEKVPPLEVDELGDQLGLSSPAESAPTIPGRPLP
jgi:hypothetical protein